MGSAAFVSKFGQSLAPMLAYSVLPHAAQAGRGAVSAARGDAIWGLLLAIPSVTVVSQLALWLGAFQLRGAYLRQVKAAVTGGDASGGGEDSAAVAVTPA